MPDPGISGVMAGWDLPRSRIRMKAAQDPAEAAHAIIDLRAEVERLRTELLEAQSHVGRANAREGYVRKLEAEVKRLHEALSALYRAADLYQAAIRPSVHGLSVERVHKLRAERLEPLLDALADAR